MFYLNSSIVVMLTQKGIEGHEWPISFMGSSLQGLELTYLAIGKQAYVVYKAVKYFRPYLLKSHIIIFVPHPAVRTLYVQQELGEKRAS